MLEALERAGFEVKFVSHAKAILGADFPEALAELEAALLVQSVPIEEIVGSGGGETKGTQRLRAALAKSGWRKTVFKITKVINGVQKESQSHEMDHVRTFDKRGVVALEIEWNNKDPFFDRDLENFKRLHGEGAINVGAILTRGPALQKELKAFVLRFAYDKKIASAADLFAVGLNPTKRQLANYDRRTQRANRTYAESWAEEFVNDKYGTATTHWDKLIDRIDRGVGNPCPLVLIGLPPSIVTFGEPAEVVEALLEEGASENE